MNIRRCLDEATVWVGERGYEQWPLPFPHEDIAAAIDRGEVYVAELEGDVVATVTLLWDDPTYWGERPADAAYVHKLAVRRACAGRRIGSAINGGSCRTRLPQARLSRRQSGHPRLLRAARLRAAR